MKKIIFFCLGMNFLIHCNANKVFDPPIMGWSSWNTYRVNINEELIKKQADALVSNGLKEVGYRYINIDDGFFGYRNSKGVMQTHPKRFPNGLKHISEYIHSLGLKAGIYSDAGSNTCGSIWDNDKNGVGSGLYGFEHQDAELYFNDWGFDFIKIDYCGACQELELDEEKRYTEIRKAIDKVAGNHISINICRWAFPGTWAKDLASSWRISGDIHPNWNSVKYIIGKNLYLSAYAGDGHYNDMDMLEIGRGMARNEEEVHFGMWCIMSSPLLIGCDMTNIPEQSLELLKNTELIALNQDRLGLQAYVVQHEGEGYVLVKDIDQLRGNVRAVALYNPSDVECKFNVPLELLELSGKTKVRDLIKRKNLGKTDKGLFYTLPARSVKVLKLESEKRIEPNRYEAEWAYMPCFNDLGKKKKPVLYSPMKEASGGMKVINIGGSKENYIEWNNVYSEKGGLYEMTVFYTPASNRKLEVSVNKEKSFIIDSLNVKDDKKISSVKIMVKLNQGYNVIRMGSSYCWAPDIDCFYLNLLSSKND